MYLTNSYFGWSLGENLLQITQNQNREYFISLYRETNFDYNRKSVTTSETAWQNFEKSEGAVEDIDEPIYWRRSSDSIHFEIEYLFHFLKLDMSLKDKSGKLQLFENNDSIYIYKWNELGKGSYLVKHKTTGESKNSEFFW